MDSFRFDEKYLSQIPALQVLVNLGYQYLTPAEALAARGGKAGNVLLEEILREQLKKLNRIQHKGGAYLFSEENIQSAIQRLKNVKYDGLLKTNEAVYDLLTLGVALEQSIEVHPDSRVLVSAPMGCPQAVIAERLRKRARWISRQLAEFEGYRPRTPARQYISGESHLWGRGEAKIWVGVLNAYDFSDESRVPEGNARRIRARRRKRDRARNVETRQ